MSGREPSPNPDLARLAEAIVARFEPVRGSLLRAAAEINEQCKPLNDAAAAALMRIVREWEAQRSRAADQCSKNDRLRTMVTPKASHKARCDAKPASEIKVANHTPTPIVRHH